jgi:uncharacterized protein
MGQIDCNSRTDRDTMVQSGAHYPERAPIDAYGDGGFRFADMSHRGSLLALPSGMHAWSALPSNDPAVLLPAYFAQVFAEAETLQFLLLGTGSDQRFPDGELQQAFAEHNIGLEAMNTGAACRTFNVLLAEGRPVAAAFIAVD